MIVKTRLGISGQIILLLFCTVAVMLVLSVGSTMISGNLQQKQLNNAIEMVAREKHHQQKIIERDLNEKIEVLSSIMAMIATEPLITHDFVTLQLYADTLSKDPDISYVVFLNSEGDVLTTSKEAEGVKTVTRDIMLENEKFGSIKIGLDTSQLDQQLIEVDKRISEFQQSADDNKKRIDKYLYIMFAILFAIVIVIYLIAALVTKNIVGPVRKMSDWARQIATGDLTHEEIDTPENEVGELNKSFSKVVKSLQAVSKVCNDIASGVFDSSVEIRSEQDILGKSVNRMGKKLKEADGESRIKISYLNSIPTPVHVIDMDFNIRFINRAGADAANRTIDECVGKKCYELFNTSHCNTDKCSAALAMKSGGVITGESIARLSAGKLPIRFTAAPLRDEAENLIGAIEYIVDITDEMKVVDIAEKISQGDFSIEIEKRSEEDRLSVAINRMTKNLREMTEKNEKQNWLKTGQTEINDRMRSEQDISGLGRNIVTFLAEYLNAQIGAIYLAGDNNHLSLVGSYAYKKRKNLSNEFAFGEGLVGQAALEKENITLTDVPEDYIAVSSGLGEAAPNNIIVMPFMFDNEVKGVIELGSLYEFSDRNMDFLNLVSENIAIAVDSAQSRQQTQALLEKTQVQAEELQTQQEELRQANEELEEQTEALKESEAGLQAQQEELQQTNEELEEQTQLLEEQKVNIKQKNMELEESRNLFEEKAKDLEITGKYKSEFLANMSHELRTPLNSILLLSKLLSDNKDHNLTEKQVEFAQTIQGSGSDLMNLINEILDLSKVESGKMELHLEDVSLQDIAETMKRNFKTVARENKLNLNIDVAQDLPAQIRTDRQRIDQVVKNLLSNAFKFTSQGSVALRICRPANGIDLSKSGLDQEKTIALSVSDTGIGIDKEKQKIIFEAFQQADGTTSRKFGGTGLGLSISRELAGFLGGELQATSKKGKGSTFTLYIPETLDGVQKAEGGRERQKAQRQKAEEGTRKPETRKEKYSTGSEQTDFKFQVSNKEYIPDDRKEISAGDKSILIIEDDPKFARILCDLSREKGFKTIVAENGETGLHFADYYRPCAIILDIGLPGMDGWAVMSRLKENSETRHIPVHFISAFDRSHDAMKMGAIGYLTKPVSMEKLEQVYEKIEHMISNPVKKLLVVEDDKAQRMAVAELIGSKDVLVTGVSTGEEANELLTTGNFDCMILDLSLPDMSGIELLSRMKNENALLHMPVIVYTGKELTKQEKAMLDEYAERIIIKDAKSPERLLDETTLFLHSVEEKLPEEKRKMLRMIHDKESILKDKKVLLVDDDMRNVFALTNILEDKGIKVLVGKNGKESLERLNENPDLDLVLMDIMMPEMDGYEATGKIRNQERFKKLPIIALTAKAMKGDRAKCIEAGANDYLAKPVDTDKLLSMLRVWLY